MTEHTPGPWEYQEDSDDYTHIVRGPNRRFICQLGQDNSGAAEANARLIAAAPDLLEALDACLHAMNYAYGGAENFAEVEKRKARAAIAKARGQ